MHLAFNAIYINLKEGQTRYLFLLHTLQSVPNKVSSDCCVLPEAFVILPWNHNLYQKGQRWQTGVKARLACQRWNLCGNNNGDGAVD